VQRKRDPSVRKGCFHYWNTRKAAPRTNNTKSRAKISAVFPLIDRERILREAYDITFANDSIAFSIAQLTKVSAFGCDTNEEIHSFTLVALLLRR
jgi:hypothetical protein